MRNEKRFKTSLFYSFMRLLAFKDTHANKTALNRIIAKAEKYKPDFMVCAGDISMFTKGLDKCCAILNKLNIKILIIPGNHETPEDIKSVCSKYPNFINIHSGEFSYNDFSFFGWGTGGFSFVEEGFERIAKQFKKVFSKKRKLIFVTHAPIYGTRLDDLRVNGLGHRGCKSTRKFVDEMNPVLVLCGHFHENFRKQDKIKNTLIINPGPDGTIINVD